MSQPLQSIQAQAVKVVCAVGLLGLVALLSGCPDGEQPKVPPRVPHPKMAPSGEPPEAEDKALTAPRTHQAAPVEQVPAPQAAKRLSQARRVYFQRQRSPTPPQPTVAQPPSQQALG